VKLKKKKKNSVILSLVSGGTYLHALALVRISVQFDIISSPDLGNLGVVREVGTTWKISMKFSILYEKVREMGHPPITRIYFFKYLFDALD